MAGFEDTAAVRRPPGKNQTVASRSWERLPAGCQQEINPDFRLGYED